MMRFRRLEDLKRDTGEFSEEFNEKEKLRKKIKGLRERIVEISKNNLKDFDYQEMKEIYIQIGFSAEEISGEKEEIEDINVFIGDLTPDDYNVIEERKRPIIIQGTVDLHGSPIMSIPEGTIINGDLNLDNCPNLSELPRGLVLNGDLFIQDIEIKSIPDDVIFNGNIYYDGYNKFPKTIKILKERTTGDIIFNSREIE